MRCQKCTTGFRGSVDGVGRLELEELGFVGDGESEQGITAVQVQLSADIGSMVFDGSDTDVQISCDLAAGLGVW